MKHKIEELKAQIVQAFGKFETDRVSGEKLIEVIGEIRDCTYSEAKKIVDYCRRKKLICSHHKYSFYYDYTMNKNQFK